MCVAHLDWAGVPGVVTVEGEHGLARLGAARHNLRDRCLEEEGLVGPSNHVGRREIFRDRDGNPM